MENYNKAQIPPGILIRIMQDKNSILNYYAQLSKMATRPKDIEYISGILLDERNHLFLFSNLYTDLFGDMPEIPEPEISQISSFIDGVKNSIKLELDSYELYCNVFFSDTDSRVREIFGRALTDENRHAAKYNFIFTQLLERA